MEFKDKDIIVRVYKTGRRAIGVFVIDTTSTHFLYLGDTFAFDGGLTQFVTYGIAIDDRYDYTYAKPTSKELSELLKNLKNSNLYKSNKHIVTVNKYINSSRKYKLEKLNDRKRF